MTSFSFRWSVPIVALAAAAALISYDGAHAEQRAKQAARAAPSGLDAAVRDNVERLLAEGIQTFRYDTFGSEDFWGGRVKLHQAIQGKKFGGVGPGISPKQALELGLKVDMEAVPKNIATAIKAGKVDLNDPATPCCCSRPMPCWASQDCSIKTASRSNPSASSARCAIPPLTMRSCPALGAVSMAGPIAI